MTRAGNESERAAGGAAGAARAWLWMHTALCLSAGHGLFLLFAVTRVNLVPSRRELGGGVTALVVLWFLASVPLAAGSLFGRRWLVGRAGFCRGLAAVAVLVTAGAFLAYFWRIRGV